LADALAVDIRSADPVSSEDSYGFCPDFTSRKIYFAWAKP
jgi:hypothetical protein